MKKLLLLASVILAASAPIALIAELAGLPGVRQTVIESSFAVFAIAGLLAGTAADYSSRRAGYAALVDVALRPACLSGQRTSTVATSASEYLCSSNR